jgi:hypothetical protein
MDEVLSITIEQFHSYVDLIYLSELEMKHTKELSICDSLFGYCFENTCSQQAFSPIVCQT